jgi:predicted helicase
LAYYIAAINIENAYHDATPDPDDGIGKENYTPFDGIVLTDTFQLGEVEENVLFSEMFPKNSERLEQQKKGPIRVIMGNPPYSIGQKSANDNAQNQSYDKLDGRIASTYAERSSAGLNKSLYDAYIKAFRWSTDRLDQKEGGIIAYVTNGAWLDGNSTDGFRKAIEDEFDSIYVFNLRGNARTQGELRRKEAGNVFKEGSRTPISITLLINNPENKREKAEIHYHDIGDYLSRDEKLTIIKDFGSLSNSEMNWKKLKPNEEGDWVNQRNEVFDTFIPIQPDKNFKDESSFFVIKSPGISTARDRWIYNSSHKKLVFNMKKFIDFYSSQVKELNDLNLKSNDETKIKWSANLLRSLKSKKNFVFKQGLINESSYRPFFKQFLYEDKNFIERPGLSNTFFGNKISDNYAINFTGKASSKDFSVLISNTKTNLDFIEKNQIIPLYYFEKNEQKQNTLFDTDSAENYIKRDGVSDFILNRAVKLYGNSVCKEDIFYYVYGILHSKEYKETFANDLKKMLPRIPLVERPKDFWAFSKAGRQLAELHINYESVSAHPDVVIKGEESEFYTVEKMRFPKKEQKDIILYNSKITLSNIPEKAYHYVVNGKSAIEWIMERYRVTVDLNKKGEGSGIKNDPNDWATEVGNPRYILDLLLSVINVSTQTVDIVNDLPKLDFEKL